MAATEFDDTQHYGFFLTGTTLTSSTGKYARLSELVLAALRAQGVLDNLEDGTTAPVDTTKLWLDKNTDPAVLKEYDSIGSAWTAMTFDRMFGRAIATELTNVGGTANAITVDEPDPFIDGRLYFITPTANNTAAVTIQVTGVGTYNVVTASGGASGSGTMINGYATVLLFTGGQFKVLFSPTLLDFQGAWDSGTTYTQAQFVTDDNKLYYLTDASSLNDDPADGDPWLEVFDLSGAGVVTTSYLETNFPELYLPSFTDDIETTTIPTSITRFSTLGYDKVDQRAASTWEKMGSAPGSPEWWEKQSVDGAWWQMVSKVVSPETFGAVGDSNETPGNGTDDTTAIELFRDYLLSIGKGGIGVLYNAYRYVPTGAWKLDVQPNGFTLVGDEPNGCGFILDAGYQFAFESDVNDIFYMRLDRVKFRGSYDSGAVLRFGKADFSDPFNDVRADIVVNNDSTHANSIGVTVNYVVRSEFFASINCGATGRPGSGTEPGAGVCLELRQAQFSKFMVTCGNGNRGILFRDGTNFALEFSATDIEEVDVAVEGTSGTINKITFHGGQFVAATCINFTTGQNIQFKNACNIAPYGGGSVFSGIVGVSFDTGVPIAYTGPSTTPSMPATGVYYTNDTGYPVQVVVGGTFTAIGVRAPDGGTKTLSCAGCATVLLLPRWEISVTHSAGSWVWLPAI